MNVTIWGARGSLAAPGPETARYGGNTSCVVVQDDQGAILVLDSGTGLRRFGMTMGTARSPRRIDIFLTHLHLDHIQGLGFFAPLYEPDVEVHIWGPSSATFDLRTRLMRYLSPPLFPIYLRDLPCHLVLHDVVRENVEIGAFRVSSRPVCHPGSTVGYRVACAGATLAYLPDHEPALGARSFPLRADWTSGYSLAAGVDLLIHDAQYTSEEYASHVGWGHSSFQHSVLFAELAGARHLVLFHHDPARSDDDLERCAGEVIAACQPVFPVTVAREGVRFEIGAH